MSAMMELNVENLIESNDGDYSKVAEYILKQYKRGIFTENEMLEMMDILAEKFSK